MNKYLFFIFFIVLFSSVYSAEPQCYYKNHFYGCDLENSDDWNCDGKMLNSLCSDTTGLCTGTCRITTSYYTSTSECSTDFLYQADTTTAYFFSDYGKLTTTQIKGIYQNNCPYGLYKEARYNYECVDWGFLNIWCNQWKTSGTYTCYDVVCAGTRTFSENTCQKPTDKIWYCDEIEDGSCDKTGYFCYEGGVAKCDSNGGYYITQNCEEFDLKCIQASSTTAVCINPTEREEAKNCTPDGSKRCNPTDKQYVQKCTNGEWFNDFPCLMACNSTGLGSSTTQCVDHNIEVGGCTNFDTFCYDIGSRAYFYICENNDWVLRSTCPTPRCNTNSTDCYEGCGFLSTMFYAVNNSGYYCNEEGAWTYSGECVGVINNVTMQCELPATCTTGTVTCSNNWVAECFDEEWRYTEQCTFGCSQGQCQADGVDIFTQFSWGADFLSLVLPLLSIFISLILLANTIGYLVKQIMNKAVIWIKGKPQ